MMEFVGPGHDPELKEVFVIKYEAEINWFVDAGFDFDYPYRDNDVLCVCTTAEKAKDYISRYARELSEKLYEAGIANKIDDTHDGWWIEVEAKFSVPSGIDYEPDMIKSNTFTFFCINYDVDRYEELNPGMISNE